MIQSPFSVVDRLIDQASRSTELPAAAILSTDRTRTVSYTRFAIMHCARKRGLSYPLIARRLNHRHHTTIMHGVREAARLIRRDPDFARLVRDLEAA